MSAKKKDPWVKWFPGDFLHGVSELEAAEGWIYVIVLNQIYDKEGPIPYDAARLARRCRLRRDVVEKAIDTLIEYEKLALSDDLMLSNPKAERTLEVRRNKSASAAEAAKTRWSKSEGKPSENKDGGDANAMRDACEADAYQKLEARSQKDTPLPPQGADGLFPGDETPSPKRPRKPRSTVSKDLAMEAVELWNEMAKRNDLSTVRWPINDQRLAKLQKRLEDGGLDKWRAALTRVERSRFLCGESAPRKIGDVPYQAGLDLLLQPSSWDRLHEGFYRLDRQAPQVVADPSSWPAERWERIHTRFRASGVWPDAAGPKPDEPGYVGPPYHP